MPATFRFQIRRSTSRAQRGQTVLPGDKLTYAITLTNHGGSQATPTLTDNVPSNTNYTGPATEGWGPSWAKLPRPGIRRSSIAPLPRYDHAYR